MEGSDAPEAAAEAPAPPTEAPARAAGAPRDAAGAAGGASTTAAPAPGEAPRAETPATAPTPANPAVADIIPVPDVEAEQEEALEEAVEAAAADIVPTPAAAGEASPLPERPSTAQPLHSRPWGVNPMPGELAAAKDASAQRRRPQSAGPGGRASTGGASSREYAGAAEPLGLTQAQQRALKKALESSPASWTVEEVLLWLEHVGFRQYRRTFAHNCVDGVVLLGLTVENLRRDLRVDALGHRAKLAQAIAELGSAAGVGTRPSRQGKPTREQVIIDSAAELERMHVEAQRKAKLERELNKALTRCEHCRTEAEKANEHLRLAEGEVQRLAGALGISKEKLEGRRGAQRSARPAPALGETGWRPVGDAAKGRKAYDAGLAVPAQLCTFQPYVSSKSKRLMEQQQGVTFIDRLQRDARVRRQKEADRRRFYTAQERGGADAITARAKKREKFLRDEIASRCGAGNAKWAFSKEEIFNQGLEAHADALRLREYEVKAVLATKGGVEVKRRALEAALQSHAFLDRLANDAGVRKNKAKELEDHIRTLEGCGSADRQKKTEERRDEARQRLQGDFGWAYPTPKEWRDASGKAADMSAKIAGAIAQARARATAAASGDQAALEKADHAAQAWARSQSGAGAGGAGGKGAGAQREAALESRAKHVHGALVLLSAMTEAELDVLSGAADEKQAFVFNQALRRQAFIWRQQKDLGERKLKNEQILKDNGPRELPHGRPIALASG